MSISPSGGKQGDKHVAATLQAILGGFFVVAGWIFLFASSDQHQISNVNDGRKGKAKDDRHFSNVDGVGERQDAADNAQIPKLDGDNALLELFRGIPLDDKAAGKSEVADVANQAPNSQFSLEIFQKVIKISGEKETHKVQLRL
jgi:hypothetical protein